MLASPVSLPHKNREPGTVSEGLKHAITTAAERPSADLRVSTGRTSHVLQAIVLENRFLRLMVLPEAGGKIWQIRTSPLIRTCSGMTARSLPRGCLMTPHTTTWIGGWDELFPNDWRCGHWARPARSQLCTRDRFIKATRSMAAKLTSSLLM